MQGKNRIGTGLRITWNATKAHARVHPKRLTFDKFSTLVYRELALPRVVDPWRRRSQRAVPVNHRSGRRIARPNRRVRGANLPRRNSRPSSLERLDQRLPRHRRILRPHTGGLGQNANRPGFVNSGFPRISKPISSRHVRSGYANPRCSRPAQHLHLGKSEILAQAAKFRKLSAKFPADHSGKTSHHTLQPLAWLR